MMMPARIDGAIPPVVSLNRSSGEPRDQQGGDNQKAFHEILSQKIGD